MRTQPVASTTQAQKRTAKPSSDITKKVWIKASSSVVYSALTDAKELVQWFCDRVSFDPREGGELAASWKTGEKGRAIVSRIVPGSALELRWIDDGKGVQDNHSNHTTGYEIRQKSGMTELVMIDRDDSTSDAEAVAILDQGWNSVLIDLRDYCERKQRLAKGRSHSKDPLPE